MMPVLEVLKPHFKKIAPFTVCFFIFFIFKERLLPHMEILCRNIQPMAPYVDQFLPLMEKEGWDTMMTFLDDISPWIDSLIPHIDVMLKHFDAFVPVVPVMAKHMDNFGPILDDLLPHTEKLIPFIPL